MNWLVYIGGGYLWLHLWLRIMLKIEDYEFLKYLFIFMVWGWICWRFIK